MILPHAEESLLTKCVSPLLRVTDKQKTNNRNKKLKINIKETVEEDICLQISDSKLWSHFI